MPAHVPARSSSTVRGRFLGFALLAFTACSTSEVSAPEQQPAPASLPEHYGTLLSHVYFQDREDLQRLVSELDVLEHVDHEKRFVAALLSWEEYSELLARGYRVEIDEEQTSLLNRQRQMLQVEASSITNYPCYRTVEETYSAMAAIASSKPNLASWVDIGDSWDKVTVGGRAGYDLRVLVLTNKTITGTKPRLFLMGATHAREYVTAELATRFAERLASEYGVNPDTTWLLDRFELHVMPHANPDGRKVAELNYLQRKNLNNTNGGGCAYPPTSSNQDGIDLNRNHTFKWGVAAVNTSPCNQFYLGPTAGSEPEVRAVESYITSLFPDQRGPADTDAAPIDTTGVVISLHSYGKLVLYPWVHTTTAAPNASALRSLGRKFAFFNNHQTCTWNTCLYAASGATEDFAYGKLGVAAYTFELGSAFFESCTEFESNILPQNLQALRYAFKAARRPYRNSLGPDSVSVSVSSASVPAGTQVRLSATADDARYFGGNHGTEPSQNIAAARYTVNVPSWVVGTTLHAMTAADGAFSAPQEAVTATLNTTGWTPGRYTLFVESQDAAGNWGAPTAVFLTIQ
ncbi:M14 family zinc carboxypeptidase [Archangium sp.]|uniref:M14 family zinc carboxypeptidase n=1 Tax=Archangium sp. TaxID=1872627 RepID=UPI002D6A98F8|nr:M14 family zinc carboxypeptidase [Archangium sp.]HYO56105.1 M14 family zinc carboxypeptidase [Archangium sp.]